MKKKWKIASKTYKIFYKKVGLDINNILFYC